MRVTVGPQARQPGVDAVLQGRVLVARAAAEDLKAASTSNGAPAKSGTASALDFDELTELIK